MTSPAPTARPLRVDLGPHRNNAAFLAAGAAPEGFDGFDGFGRAYPADELGPAAAYLDLPRPLGRGAADNVACEGQVVELDDLPLVQGIEVVGAGTGGTVSETVLLRPADGGPAAEVHVELSDFLSRRPVFDDRCFAHSPYLYDIGGRLEYGAEARLWRCTARLPRPMRCRGLVLPVNPDLHVMAVWLLAASDGTAPHPTAAR